MITKKSARRTRKRTLRRRRQSALKRTNATLITRGVSQGFATEAFVKQGYCFFNQRSVGIPGFDKYQLRTSTFDPDYTGGGHQPLYRDQMFEVYNYSCVYGMKIEADLSLDIGTNTPIYIGYAIRPDNSTDNDISTVAERSRAKLKTLTQNGVTKLKAYVNVPKVYGITKSAMFTDDLFRNDDSTNPTNSAYITLYVQSSGFTAFTVNICVRLTLYVKYFGLKRIGIS